MRGDNDLNPADQRPGAAGRVRRTAPAAIGLIAVTALLASLWTDLRQPRPATTPDATTQTAIMRGEPPPLDVPGIERPAAARSRRDLGSTQPATSETVRVERATPASLPAHLDEKLQRDIAIAWADAVVEQVRRTGRLCVIVHVGLSDRSGRRAARPAPGREPPIWKRDPAWGGRYGIETFFPRVGWTMELAEDQTAGPIARRILLKRRVPVSPGWQRRGVAVAFDLYVLAVAWNPTHLVEAMNQPLRDALLPSGFRLAIPGAGDIDFAREAVVSGYFGPNRRLREAWDPLAGLPNEPPRACGIFYLAPQSAVYFHEPVAGRRLYSVLFARRGLVTEAYVLHEMLSALWDATFDDGFAIGAARGFARHQKLTQQAAEKLFYR